MLVQLCLAHITEANHSLCCAQGCPGLWLTGSSSEPEQPQDVALMEQTQLEVSPALQPLLSQHSPPGAGSSCPDTLEDCPAQY